LGICALELEAERWTSAALRVTEGCADGIAADFAELG
jgi:hypothetical protein